MSTGYTRALHFAQISEQTANYTSQASMICDKFWLFPIFVQTKGVFPRCTCTCISSSFDVQCVTQLHNHHHRRSTCCVHKSFPIKHLAHSQGGRKNSQANPGRANKVTSHVRTSHNYQPTTSHVSCEPASQFKKTGINIPALPLLLPLLPPSKSVNENVLQGYFHIAVTSIQRRT